jgi:hypothetical protein
MSRPPPALGISDIGAVGSRGSVAMIEVDRLNTEDGVALIREHHPPRPGPAAPRLSAAPKKPPPHASSSSY